MKNLMLIFIMCFFNQCSLVGEGDGKNLLGDDVRLFKNSPVWEIAKAIDDKDTFLSRKLLKDLPKSSLNYQEKKYGQTLLAWSIYSDNFQGFKILLESGVDVNKVAHDSTQAINWAANKYETSNYIKLLLKHNIDVNHVAATDGGQIVRTPLIAAAWYNLESTKMLVEAGAEVNYFYSEGPINNSPLYASFKGGKMNIIRYLIIDVNADYKHFLQTRLNGDSIYAVDLMRTLTFPLDSKEYLMKMEVVEYLKKQGIDYQKVPIPEHFYELYDKNYLLNY